MDEVSQRLVRDCRRCRNLATISVPVPVERDARCFMGSASGAVSVARN
jgi:hypothetical protein